VAHHRSGRKPLDFSTGRSLVHNRGVLASNGMLHAPALQPSSKLGLSSAPVEYDPYRPLALLISILAVLAAFIVTDRVFERMAHIEDENGLCMASPSNLPRLSDFTIAAGIRRVSWCRLS